MNSKSRFHSGSLIDWGIDMNEHNCFLVMSNENEWNEHLEEVKKHSEGKTEDELLKEAFTFDFKFSLIER